MSSHAQAHHPTNYVKIWAILVVLLVVSVLGPMLGHPIVTLITAFGIALVKAYLVAKNFMHINVEKPIVHWILGAALVIMVVLYAGVMPDVGRDAGERWKKDAGWHDGGTSEHAAPAEKDKDKGATGH